MPLSQASVRRGTASCTAVQISSHHRFSKRLRRPALRKASGFPVSAAAFVLLRAVRRLTDCAEEVVQVQVPRKGEAFPQIGRRSRRSSLARATVIWTGLERAVHLQIISVGLALPPGMKHFRRWAGWILAPPLPRRTSFVGMTVIASLTRTSMPNHSARKLERRPTYQVNVVIETPGRPTGSVRLCQSIRTWAG